VICHLDLRPWRVWPNKVLIFDIGSHHLGHMAKGISKQNTPHIARYRETKENEGPSCGRRRLKTVVALVESRFVDVVLRTELRPWNLARSEYWRRLVSAEGGAPVVGPPCRMGLGHTDQPRAAMIRNGLLGLGPGRVVRSVHRPAVGSSPCAACRVLVASSQSLGESWYSARTTA
jgi:hypothetical protein